MSNPTSTTADAAQQSLYGEKLDSWTTFASLLTDPNKLFPESMLKGSFSSSLGPANCNYIGGRNVYIAGTDMKVLLDAASFLNSMPLLPGLLQMMHAFPGTQSL